MIASATLSMARDAFASIGYRKSLLWTDYRFADLLGESPSVRTIDLAAFAQEPPSYRNACFGVLLRDEPIASANSGVLDQYRSLGAPQLLVISEPRGITQRWKMRADANPQLVDEIPSATLREYVDRHEEYWAPEAVMRAKTIGIDRAPTQIDFYDLGLLPALEREVTQKLDGLFKEVLHVSNNTFRRAHGRRPRRAEEVGIFRLIFRLLAAKLLRDRGVSGEWDSADATTSLAAVNSVYLRDSADRPALDDTRVQQAAWDQMLGSLHLQNLSVEALAYVYENTLISREARSTLGTHATPPEIAEFIVRQLPFESLPADQRTVFEPFAGHAPFLIAALGRLKELLPDMSPQERHGYFVSMLSGMELDTFAAEVARYSLMLADYPNANGWRIETGDVFASDRFDDLLQGANIVLSNPPFGAFENRSSTSPATSMHPQREVEAVKRILAHPPRMLGLVLPRKFIDAAWFREARAIIDRRYDSVAVSVFEQGKFSHADVETATIVASQRHDGVSRSRVSMFIANRDFDVFVRRGTPTWSVRSAHGREEGSLWHTPLDPVWQTLRDRPPLESALHDWSRGIEYTGLVRDDWSRFVSDKPKPRFVAGLHTARGLQPFVAPRPVYLRIDDDSMRGKAHLKPWREPKVLVPATRLSRGPWPVLGVVDRRGLAAYQSFHGFWPTADWPLEVVAAILSGPLANAFVDTHSATRRHNMSHVLRAIPLPKLARSEMDEIVALVREYERRLATLLEHHDGTHRLLMTIDAIVLSGYQLSPRHERALLDHCSDRDRPGVPGFDRYYPRDFRSAVPLRMYLSREFAESGAARTVERLRPIAHPLAAEIAEVATMAPTPDSGAVE